MHTDWANAVVVRRLVSDVAGYERHEPSTDWVNKTQNIGRHAASAVEFLKKEEPLHEKSRSFHYCQQREYFAFVLRPKRLNG